MGLHVRRPLVPAVALALLLLATAFALGACSFSLSCGNAAEGVTAYTDADYGFAFEYPAAWKLQQEDAATVTAGAAATGNVGVFDPDGANEDGSYYDLVEVSVYELNTTVDDSIMPDIKTEVERSLAGLESQEGDWKRLDDLADVALSGLQGWKVNYSFTIDGQPALCTFYLLFGGTLEYQLLVQAVDENWEADQPIFDAFVASFRPGPATSTTAGTSD